MGPIRPPDPEQCPVRGPGLGHVHATECGTDDRHRGHTPTQCCECGRDYSAPAQPHGANEPALRANAGQDGRTVRLDEALETDLLRLRYDWRSRSGEDH